MEVSTVSRQESTVGRSQAAIFVLTNEMIRRSGARNIPEVLRMAPGANVARIDANKWAISVRGFNGRFANKLLIQINGRGVYTPLFGGTFWDVQNVVLEDVDRLEALGVPSYNTLDIRLAWQPNTRFEAALVGCHLLDPTHPEFGLDLFAGNVRTEVQHEMYGMLTYHV